MKKPDFKKGKASDHLDTLWEQGVIFNKRLVAMEKEMKIIPVIKTKADLAITLLLVILVAIVGQYFGLSS